MGNGTDERRQDDVVASSTDDEAGAASAEQAEPGSGSAAGGGRTSSVREVVERTLLVGVGAAGLTADKLQAVVDDLVKRGQLTSKEGREVVEDLASRSRTEAKSALGRADSSLQGAFKEMGLAGRRDLEDLDFRLRQLEHRLSLVERQLDEQSAADTGA
jgi:polyhydroxyalkanoate synthesis regulator phasin